MPTYVIPTSNADSLLRSIEKLSKRALKLGMTPPTVTKTGTKLLTMPSNVSGLGLVEVEHTIFTITGQTPIIDGWELIGAIRHIDGKNIISQIPFTTDIIPVKYRDAKPFCNHCSTHRVKIYSYIIRNKDTGETMQVGKTCMKDYFNRDITQYINWWKNLDQFFTDLESDGSSSFNENDIRYEFREALEVAFACVRIDGYSKSDSPYPTKTDVKQHMTGFRKTNVKEEDVVSAGKAIEWLMKQDDSSDFINNLHNLLNIDMVPDWSFGYISALVPCYIKSQQSQVPVLNKWYGREKQREEMTLVLKKMFVTDGFYGATYIHTFLDSQNRMFVWFASKDIKMEMNVPTLVKATITGHDKFKGVKQTKINRLVVVK